MISIIVHERNYSHILSIIFTYTWSIVGNRLEHWILHVSGWCLVVFRSISIFRYLIGWKALNKSRWNVKQDADKIIFEAKSSMLPSKLKPRYKLKWSCIDDGISSSIKLQLVLCIETICFRLSIIRTTKNQIIINWLLWELKIWLHTQVSMDNICHFNIFIEKLMNAANFHYD